MVVTRSGGTASSHRRNRMAILCAVGRGERKVHLLDLVHLAVGAPGLRASLTCHGMAS